MNRAEAINVENDGGAIALRDVSKFYGDVLGVNRISLKIEPGITGLVGPNGSGKSTLMNLIAGLIPSTRGSVEVKGVTPSQPETFFRQLGYCTQYDSFPSGVNGYEFIRNTLRIHGYDKSTTEALTLQALQQVDLMKAAKKSVEAYSKGMRQRIRKVGSLCLLLPISFRYSFGVPIRTVLFRLSTMQSLLDLCRFCFGTCGCSYRSESAPEVVLP